MPARKYSDEVIFDIIARRKNNQTWKEIEAAYEDIPPSSIRTMYRRNVDRMPRSEDSIQVKQGSPNTMTVATRSARVLSLEDLLERCSVDLSVWAVDRYVINSWPGWRANKQIDMSWDEGKASGRVVDEGGIRVEELVQVKAWLVRKEPVPLFPHIVPIAASSRGLRPSKRPKTKTSDYKKTLVVSDIHAGFMRHGPTSKLIPFHDRLCMDVILSLVADTKPDGVLLIGDNLDLPMWTDKFLRSPEIFWLLQPALIELHHWLSSIRRLVPSSDIIYIEGNHEKRMRDMVAKNLPAAYGLKSMGNLSGVHDHFSVPNLLDLGGLDIDWVGDYPGGSVWIADDLEIEHGNVARATPGSTANSLIAGSSHSLIFGHLHRPELVNHVKRTREGPVVVKGICPGCVCRVDGVVPGHKPKSQNWGQGVALITEHIETKVWSCDLVAIKEGKAVYGGKLYEGRDRSGEIESLYPGWDGGWGRDG